ncbi:hypothetical protein [Massilia rubra]|uniref:Lipocalin-like domain-containing protein n=1 Tax=Massilia rubra TaxID=2607910 RepID=A0ABX0LWA2_9BURK|nr:hypothetical protein [Massilia rubra]NHZ34371.1 hypothetical protein [Massilia rubra]
MRLLIAASLSVLLQACSRTGHTDAPPAINSKMAELADDGVNRLNMADDKFQDTDWGKVNLPGKRLELIDPVRIEDLRFHADGYVIATIGTKEVLAGPIFYWKVKNGVLLLSDNKNFSSVFSELSAPRVETLPASDAKQIVSVTAKNGRQLQYTLSQRR